MLTAIKTMSVLQGLSLTSAIIATGVGLASVTLHSSDLASAGSLGNVGAFLLFTSSGLALDLNKGKIRPERIVALMGLLLAASFNIMKLSHLPIAVEYPTLDTLGLGLTMGIFGLLRHEPDSSLDLRSAIGRRNASAYLISALGFGVQILSALGMHTTEVLPWLAGGVVATIGAVVFSDLHAVIPASKTRLPHFFALATAGLLVAAVIMFAKDMPEYKALISALIATFVAMHATFIHERLHQKPATPEIITFEPTSSTSNYMLWLVGREPAAPGSASEALVNVAVREP